MLENLLLFDKWLFFAINNGWENPFFNKLMPLITENNSWLLVYIFSLILLVWKGGRNGRILTFTLLLTILISDQLNSHFIKELVGRIRPCHDLNGVHLLVGCGGGKSFPSSHAVNNFAAAMVISQFYNKHIWIFYLIASLVAFSRVYVGVHYPLDIFAGSLEGMLIGFSISKLVKFLDLKFLLKKAN